MLVFPLFLIYQIGVLFTLPVLNGADFLTVFLFRNLGLSATAYLGYTVAVARRVRHRGGACSGASSTFDPKPDRARCCSRARSTP